MLEREQLVSMVCAVQKGEKNAAAKLYDTFYEEIYHYLLKIVKDAELAADLTQDSFLEIFQSIDSLKEPVAFVTWSRTIAYHKCTAYFKKRKDLLADEEEDGYSVFDTAVEKREEFIPDEAVDKEELRKAIQEMIESLPAEQREAIRMRYFEEISVKKIAEIQGVTEGTVKSRLNYGRKTLKLAVEEYERKTGVKIHSDGIIPLLLWAFQEEQVQHSLLLAGDAADKAVDVLDKVSAVVAATTTTAAVTSTAVTVAKKGVKETINIVTKRIILGATILTASVGGAKAHSIQSFEARTIKESLQNFVNWKGLYTGEETLGHVLYTITDQHMHVRFDLSEDGDNMDSRFTGISDTTGIENGVYTYDSEEGSVYAMLIQVKDETYINNVLAQIKINLHPYEWPFYNNELQEYYPYYGDVTVDEFTFHVSEDLILVTYVNPELVESGEKKSSQEMNSMVDAFCALREDAAKKPKTDAQKQWEMDIFSEEEDYPESAKELDSQFRNYSPWVGYNGFAFEEQAMNIMFGSPCESNALTNIANMKEDSFLPRVGIRDRSNIERIQITRCTLEELYFVLLVRMKEGTDMEAVVSEMKTNIDPGKWMWYDSEAGENVPYFSGVSVEDFSFHVSGNYIMVYYVEPEQVDAGNRKSAEEMNKTLDVIVWLRDQYLERLEEME